MSVSPASEQEWNRLRNAFAVSLMAETSLTALAQNIEAGDWPISGVDETPSKYIVYSWDELRKLPQFAQQPILLDLLIRILTETLSFDEPFQEMVESSQKTMASDYSAIKTLTKLQIPEDFPIALTALSDEAKDLCKSQGFRTLGEYVRLSQKISQLIIMEGDFRSFLNALSHVDEATIARYLPFRRGEKGLHLAEAIAALLRSIPQAELCALARSVGYKNLNPDQVAMAGAVSKQRLADVQTQFRNSFTDQLTWFRDEAQDWRLNQTGNLSLPYRLRVLNDPMLEAIGYGLVHVFFVGEASPAQPAVSAASGASPVLATEDKPSLWRRFLRMFGK